LLGGNQRRTGSQEWVVDHGAALGMVQERPAHQFDRLLRAVARLLFVLVSPMGIEVFDFPYGTLGPVAAPVRLLALANRVPARFVPPMIIISPEDEVLLRPDDLGANLKADA